MQGGWALLPVVLFAIAANADPRSAVAYDHDLKRPENVCRVEAIRRIAYVKDEPSWRAELPNQCVRQSTACSSAAGSLDR